MKEILEIAGPIVCALIVAWSGWQARQNKRLRRKVRWILLECQAFSRLEDAYCDATSDGSLGQLSFRSALAIKRCFRHLHRQQGIATPTITPQEITRELGKL